MKVRYIIETITTDEGEMKGVGRNSTTRFLRTQYWIREATIDFLPDKEMTITFDPMQEVQAEDNYESLDCCCWERDWNCNQQTLIITLDAMGMIFDEMTLSEFGFEERKK